MKQKLTIGIISPSNSLLSLYPNRVKNGIKFLQSQKIQIRFSKHAKDQLSYVSSSIENRIKDFNQFLENDEIDVIMASMGGYNSNQLIQQIDYEKIQKSKKIICGYSDITALLLAIHVKTGNIVYHGPTFLPEICEYPTPFSYTWQYFWRIIHQEKLEYYMPQEVVTQFMDWAQLEKGQVQRKKENNTYLWKTMKKGKAVGKIIGGNLSTIMNLLGSEYLPYDVFKNKILFIEECDTSIAKLDSLFYGLYLQGIFSQIQGLVIGKFNQKEINKNMQIIEKIIKKITKDKTYPIICNVDLGHTDPMITIPIGATVELDAQEQIKFKIIEY